MSGRRVAVLFLYAFTAMTLPVMFLLAITTYSRTWTSMTTWWALAYVAYGLVQVFLVFPMMGSWATAVLPQTGVRLSCKDLKAKLLSLNDAGLPFSVTQDPKNEERLVASWKIADEKWIELFAARGLRVQYELKMRLAENKGVVLAQDNYRRFEYAGGPGLSGVRFRRQFSFFKGIMLFRYERAAQYGVIYKNGELKIDYSYNYKFDPDEVKNPIVSMVTGSGWEFRPVVFIH
ncbi:MAG: hypothetical protein V1857_07205 [archaeon]